MLKTLISEVYAILKDLNVKRGQAESAVEEKLYNKQTQKYSDEIAIINTSLIYTKYNFDRIEDNYMKLIDSLEYKELNSNLAVANDKLEQLRNNLI